MNVKVTGVPMRMRRMSTSVDPRVGQLVTRPSRRGVWECKHYCTKAPRLHDDLTTRDTRPDHTTTGLALWSSLTLETRSHPWVPAGHPQYTGACFARKVVDGPKPPQVTRKSLRTLTRPDLKPALESCLASPQKSLLNPLCVLKGRLMGTLERC